VISLYKKDSLKKKRSETSFYFQLPNFYWRILCALCFLIHQKMNWYIFYCCWLLKFIGIFDWQRAHFTHLEMDFAILRKTLLNIVSNICCWKIIGSFMFTISFIDIEMRKNIWYIHSILSQPFYVSMETLFLRLTDAVRPRCAQIINCLTFFYNIMLAYIWQIRYI
jgi:hypothetical protein